MAFLLRRLFCLSAALRVVSTVSQQELGWVDGFQVGVPTAPRASLPGRCVQQYHQQQQQHYRCSSSFVGLYGTASTSSSSTSGHPAPSPPPSDFFPSLLERFQGDFDNYHQVVRDRQEGLLPRKGGGHEQIHCLLLPVTAVVSTMTPTPSSSNTTTKKAARLAAFYFDGIPQRIFRFRYYELTETATHAATMEEEEEDSQSEVVVVDMKLYCLHPALEGQMRGMEDPLDWPSTLEAFAATAASKDEEVVTLLEKCDVQWSRDLDPVQHAYAVERNLELETQQQQQSQGGDQDSTILDRGIHAVMTYGEATVESTMMPGTQIRIMDQLSLWEDQFWIHDRGFDPTTGAFIYGNQRGVPYQLERVATIVKGGGEDDGRWKRQVVNPSLQWTLGPTWRTEEEYQAKLEAVGGGVSSQLNSKQPRANKL